MAEDQPYHIIQSMSLTKFIRLLLDIFQAILGSQSMLNEGDLPAKFVQIVPGDAAAHGA